jgi:zinc protease
MSVIQSLPGSDDVTRITLPNNITILVRSNFNSPSISLAGYFAAGSLFDSDEKLGLADFAITALMRGTQTRSFEEIYDALEAVGAHLGFSAGTHTSGFSGRALVEDLPLVMDLLADCLRNPIYPADEIERLRTQLLTGLSIRAQDTGDVASMAFDKIIFGSHPYARPDDGYPETVRAITRDDITAFQKRCFGPDGLTLAIVGAVEAEFVHEQIARTLGDWSNPQQPALPGLPTVTPLVETVRQHSSLAGKSQTDIMIGVLGPERKAPEYTAASLGNSILGQFGMMGRIGDVVREQSGLAYYASSSLSAGVGPGTWEVSAGVNPANVEKAVALILEEIRQFTQDGVSSEELQDSQDNFVGRLPLSMESNAGVASSLLNIERHGLGMDYYRKYEAMVRAVTPEMVQAAAQKYLNPDALAISTAGP